MGEGRGAVIFLTGPPGAGKTSTSWVWSLQRARPTWPLEWDATAAVLGSARELGMACLPEGMDERYRLAAHALARHAELITTGGNDCIIVGAWALDWPGESPWEPVAALDPVVCVLLPDVETSVARNTNDHRRQGVFAVPESYVRSSYELDWRRWQDHPRAAVVDNSQMTIQQTVDALEHAVDRLVGR